MTIKFKKLNPDVSTPKHAKKGDAGYDLTASSYTFDTKTQNYIYGTGIAVEIPEGYVGLVFPRSSIRDKEVFMTNHVGVIDSGYRGEIFVTFKQRDVLLFEFQPYELGERICQLVIVPYLNVDFEEVEELSKTERGDNGHGSSGK